MSKKTKNYIISIIIPLIVGGIVGLIISKYIDYDMLQKPALAPPAILFPIIWTIIYILMGISYGMLKNKFLLDSGVRFFYYVQLGINALWSIFFFVFKWRLFSFFWIILLDIAVIMMIVKFYYKNKTAGLLQIPYLIWSLFATYLNLGVYLLNKI